VIDAVQQTMRFDEFERIDGCVYKITYESSGILTASDTSQNQSNSSDITTVLILPIDYSGFKPHTLKEYRRNHECSNGHE
jgi:hypothetical protein